MHEDGASEGDDFRESSLITKGFSCSTAGANTLRPTKQRTPLVTILMKIPARGRG